MPSQTQRRRGSEAILHRTLWNNRLQREILSMPLWEGKGIQRMLEGEMQAEREMQEKVARPLPEGTLWVRFVFVDHAGIPKCKAVYRDGFDGRARAGVGLAKGVLALDPSGALHPESGLSPVGECRLVPDLSTLTVLPFARGQAMGGLPA